MEEEEEEEEEQEEEEEEEKRDIAVMSIYTQKPLTSASMSTKRRKRITVEDTSKSQRDINKKNNSKSETSTSHQDKDKKKKNNGKRETSTEGDINPAFS